MAATDPCERLVTVVGDPIVEHATERADGSMQVRTRNPVLERIIPLERWIRSCQRNGVAVHTRKVIVVEDWHEVPE